MNLRYRLIRLLVDLEAAVIDHRRLSVSVACLRCNGYAAIRRVDARANRDLNPVLERNSAAHAGEVESITALHFVDDYRLALLRTVTRVPRTVPKGIGDSLASAAHLVLAVDDRKVDIPATVNDVAVVIACENNVSRSTATQIIRAARAIEVVLPRGTVKHIRFGASEHGVLITPTADLFDVLPHVVTLTRRAIIGLVVDGDSD